MTSNFEDGGKGRDYYATESAGNIISPKQVLAAAEVKVRIFFNQNGGTYNASAVSIGNYAIWTAGHCVHAGNGRADGWSTNLVFVPAYKDGQAPYGVWNASYLITRTNWYQNGHSSEDMGGAVLRPNSVGRKISEVVGWMGFAWNFSRFQHWTLLGYPSNPLPGAPPFNGERMYQNSASYAYSHAVTGVDTLGVGNRMSQGCSGGPWVLGFGTGNYVNGNNSYFNVNGYEEMFSPYFDNRAKSLKDDLVGGSP